MGHTRTSGCCKLLRLALGVLLLLAVQGVQCEHEPTESECRPYIEKALKDHHVDPDESAESPADTQASSIEQEENPPIDEGLEINEGQTSDESQEGTTEDTGSEGGSTEEGDVPSGENADSVEGTEGEDSNKTDEENETTEQSDKEETDAGSIEGDTTENETAETDENATVEQGDEGTDSVEEVVQESEQESAESDTAEAEGSQAETTETEGESKEDVKAEAQEGSDEATTTNEESQEADTLEADSTAEEAEGDSETKEATDEENKSETEEASNEEQAVEASDETQEAEGKESDQTSGEGATETEADSKDDTAENTSQDETETVETVEDKTIESESEPAVALSEETVETSQETVETASQETVETASQETVETASQETVETASQETVETASQETAEVKEESPEKTDETTETTETAEDETEEQKTEEVAESSQEESQQEVPEEDLTKEVIIPANLRSRNHITQILKLDQESIETESALAKTVDTTLKTLKNLYDNAIKPLEILYKYRDLSNRHFGDPEIFSKPLILFMGPWSGGKSSTINYLLDLEFTELALRTGAEPSPAYFNILTYGEDVEILDGTQLAADFTFSGLQKFGQGLLDRLRGVKLPNRLLEKVNIVEIPGILEIRKQVQRLFPFNDACQWFIDRADIIFLVYDPAKLDVGPETEAILDQLKGREYQTRIILNKADQVKPEELMRVQGTLIWNISPLMSSQEPPVMYTTSLWSLPYETSAPTRLLHAQERAFLRDLRDAIDRRVENKIASARRFAVRVRNHAKMVDCYLTTYYNHKTFFGNRKKISDDIIETPQKYHIYEGLSTLTNISRYDLPDPEMYKDFFRINPLYDFTKLSDTCTYFRGCPINKLDVAIAYDLPELVGKYKKAVDAAKPSS